MTHRRLFIIVLIISLNLFACKQAEKQVENPQIDITNPKDILEAVEAAHGGWNHLRSKNDVEYHYEYTVPEGKADISTERYIFDSETSFGHYTRHEINTLPNEDGIVIHLFDGEKTTLTLDGNAVENEQTISVGQFVRRANYFWFVMPYKLNDPGTIAKYLGKEVYNGIDYTKLEITYDAKVTGKEKNDIYILYVNQKTQLIDRFYFSLPFLGINAPVILAEYTYEMVEGQKLATKRNYYLPKKDGTYDTNPSITQKLSNIKFNNGFTPASIAHVG
ncbi:DUF6503 family protein [Maribacter aestuarii]|uniref:DUF6503 family protein n=1 Tax=Maribacter aestuarii TaxID=1130723 RepID=UPI0025A5E938|nr:DUF6503 family protein [Maribacter aestuarii]